MRDNTLKVLGTIGIVTTGLVLCVREICKALPTNKDKLLKDTFEDPLFSARFDLEDKSDDYTEGFDAGFDAGYKEAKIVYDVPQTDPFDSELFPPIRTTDTFDRELFPPLVDKPFSDGLVSGLFEGANVHIDTLNIGDGYYTTDNDDESDIREEMKEFEKEAQLYKDCTDFDETGDEPDEDTDEWDNIFSELESEEGIDLEDIPQVEIPKKKTATPGTTGTDYMTPKEKETEEKSDEDFFNDAVSNVMQ